MDIWTVPSLGSSMKDTTVDIHVCIFVWTYVSVSVEYIPRSGLAGSYSIHTCMLNFLKILPN